MKVDGLESVEKAKSIMGNVMAAAIGYGVYSIADELIKKKFRRLYFNKGLLGKFSVTCVELFVGFCAWDYSKERLAKIL